MHDFGCIENFEKLKRLRTEVINILIKIQIKYKKLIIISFITLTFLVHNALSLITLLIIMHKKFNFKKQVLAYFLQLIYYKICIFKLNNLYYHNL